MRYLIFSLVFFFVVPQVSLSQDMIRDYVKGTYYQDDQLNRFAGEWAGSNGSDSLLVSLHVKKTYVESMDVYIDQLCGYHMYWKDGKLMESSKGNEQFSLAGGNFEDNSNLLIEGLFLQINREELGYFRMRLDNIEDTTAEWHLFSRRHTILMGDLAEADKLEEPRFRVPQEMVLQKIE